MDNEKDKDKKKSLAQRASAQAKSDKKRGGIREYFKGVKIEMKKVVWPTRKELISYTGVVLFTCIIFGLGIWAVDSGFLAALKAGLNISF